VVVAAGMRVTMCGVQIVPLPRKNGVPLISERLPSFVFRSLPIG
jgi:hypothetical protein